MMQAEHGHHGEPPSALKAALATFAAFLVIGAMKCGTSSLHEQLSRRPNFFLSTPKEPNFFGDDDQFRKGTVWYESLFAGASPGQRCGESSTHYTKLPDHPHTVDRMHALIPGARLVYVMRHPIERHRRVGDLVQLILE